MRRRKNIRCFIDVLRGEVGVLMIKVKVDKERSKLGQ